MALIKRLPVDELAVLIVEEEVGGRGEEGRGGGGRGGKRVESSIDTDRIRHLKAAMDIQSSGTADASAIL